MTLSTRTLFGRRQWKSFFALLAATAALVGGAQVLAPAPAKAMIVQNMTEQECEEEFGIWSWFDGTCELNIGGGAASGGVDGGGGGTDWDKDGAFLPTDGDDGGQSPFPDDWIFDQGNDPNDPFLPIPDAETQRERVDRQLREAIERLRQAQQALDDAVIRDMELSRLEEFEAEITREKSARPPKPPRNRVKPRKARRSAHPRSQQ